MKFSGDRHLVVTHVRGIDWLKKESTAAITTGRKVDCPELPLSRITPLHPIVNYAKHILNCMVRTHKAGGSASHSVSTNTA